MTQVRPVLDLLDSYQPDAHEHSAYVAIRQLLESGTSPFDRTVYQPGHLTASGFVVSPDGGRGLVIWHARLGRWLQPGGHLDPADHTPWETAAREVHEETGLRVEPGDSPCLIGVDVHDIPATRGEPAHHHFDLCFLFRADTETVTPSTETPRVEWWPFETIDRELSDAALVRYARRARDLSDPYPSNRDC